MTYRAGLVLFSCLLSAPFAYAKDAAPVYSPDSAAANAAYSQAEPIVLPKFIDDEDLNFDNLTEEDLQPLDTSSSSSSKVVKTTPPPEPQDSPQDLLPILQKDAHDVLPSQKPAPADDGFNKLPIEAPSQSSFSPEGEKSLTETLSEKNAPLPEENNDSPQEEPKSETWLSKLKSPLSGLGKSSSSDSSITLEDMVENSPNRRSGSNASVFDISGVMLRMSMSQVNETMRKKGFRKVYQKLDIPNFIRWRNEERCRNQGVVGYERLENCVAETAKKDNHQYVALTKYTKFETKEEISVRFTSNFTNNKVYKIIYKSMASTIQGNSPKAIYLRNIKIYDFWKKVNHKYGAPDNKEAVTWGLGGNKPYMQAATGLLILEDPMLRELDYTRMSREDQLFMNTDLYSF